MDSKQFLTEFGYVALAPNGVATLRLLILNLAVSGRLTSQDPNEQASVFLKDISQEREKLIDSGNIKKNKRVRQGELQGYWVLPNNWVWVRLGELCSFTVGRTPSRKEEQYWNTGDYPWFSIGDLVHGKTVRKAKETVSESARREVFKYEPVKAGTLLMSFKLSIGKLSVLGVDAYYNEAIIAIKPFDDALQEYLFRCLSGFNLTVENKAAIMGQTLNQDSIPNIKIALPPREEIPRIVAKVNELMALCDKLEDQRQKRDVMCKLSRKAALDDLATAQNLNTLTLGWNRFRDGISLWLDTPDSVDDVRNAVGFLGCRGLLTEEMSLDLPASKDGRFSLPNGWSWLTLRDLAEYITSGSRGWRQYMAPQGDIFIRSQDIKHDALIFEDRAFVNLPDRAEGMRTLVRRGDLLITITGANVGKCAQVPLLSSRAYVSQHVALVRVRDTRNTPFLHWWITNTFGGRKYLARFIYGDKPGLNLPQVGSIPIPLPPQDVQDRIVKTLNHYIAICNRLSTQVEEARKLADLFATSAIASITGIRIEEKEKMKAPKTELVSTLRAGVSPAHRDQAPLTAILIKNNGELSAKLLWSISGLEIDEFYQQLKTEMARGWIVQPEVAYMKEVESR